MRKGRRIIAAEIFSRMNCINLLNPSTTFRQRLSIPL